MSSVEETIKAGEMPRATVPIFDRGLNFLSSVRFGVALLCILVVLSMIGMLVIQQNVQGFDTYYASLTPAERLVYGKLGLFDIYHGWYFNVLLLVLSLNIILASIDRFPSAWAYIKSPKVSATREWLLSQKQHAVLESGRMAESGALEAVKTTFAANGMRPSSIAKDSISYAVDENGKKIFDQTIKTTQQIVFGEKGRINRLGAYIVHVALLTLFLGHFVALQTGWDANLRMIPGNATDKMEMVEYDVGVKKEFEVQVPFTMTCTDIQQKLIDPNGSIDVTNTLDWRTQMKIEDPEYGTTIANISMNQPLQYRGYRFFQAQTIPVGNARSISLELIPQNGGETVKAEIPRMGSTTLADGTLVEFDEFLPDFTFNAQGKPDTRSGEYNKPAAVLNVTPPGGERTRVFAFGSGIAENIPVGAPKFGFKWKLAGFEKSPFAHVLSIKYDPYNGSFIAWYFGGFGLIGALIFVFFFSHRRVWAILSPTKDGRVEVVLGGHTNRNHAAFEEKFGKLVRDVNSRIGVTAG